MSSRIRLDGDWSYTPDHGATDAPEPYDWTPDELTLGPCGCVDYHYADCDVFTGGGGRNTKADWDDHDWDADEQGGY